jgi:SAM-dependent methyltransferase
LDDPTCTICEVTQPGSFLLVKEMMFGLGDVFSYWECPGCGTVQLQDPPTSWDTYYPAADYYSYRPGPRAEAAPGVVVRLLADVVLRVPLPKRFYEAFKLPRSTRWFRGLRVRRGSNILDVGAGSGSVLHGLASVGFYRLTGVDPFVAASITFPNGVRIVKGDIEDIDGQFDVIMFNHSLEHMAEPRRALDAARERMTPGGWLIIRIPLADSWAFEKYREHWSQLDAPRHQFLYTTRSLKIVLEGAGLEVHDMFRDSHAFGLFGSEQYRRDIPLTATGVFSNTELSRYGRQARKLNRRGLGDQACFVMKRSRS